MEYRTICYFITRSGYIGLPGDTVFSRTSINWVIFLRFVYNTTQIHLRYLLLLIQKKKNKNNIGDFRCFCFVLYFVALIRLIWICLFIRKRNEFEHWTGCVINLHMDRCKKENEWFPIARIWETFFLRFECWTRIIGHQNVLKNTSTPCDCIGARQQSVSLCVLKHALLGMNAFNAVFESWLSNQAIIVRLYGMIQNFFGNHGMWSQISYIQFLIVLNILFMLLETYKSCLININWFFFIYNASLTIHHRTYPSPTTRRVSHIYFQPFKLYPNASHCNAHFASKVRVYISLCRVYVCECLTINTLAKPLQQTTMQWSVSVCLSASMYVPCSNVLSQMAMANTYNIFYTSCLSASIMDIISSCWIHQ